MQAKLLKFLDILAGGIELSALGKTRVMAIGEIMLGCHLSGVAKPPVTSVPVVRVDRRQQTLGGAANLAMNLRRLGAEVMLLSVIGDDWEGSDLRQMLESHAIATSSISLQAGRQTLAQYQVMAASQLLAQFEQGSTEAINHQTEQALIAQLNSYWNTGDAVIISDRGSGILTARVRQAIAQLQQSQPRLLVIDCDRLDYGHLNPTIVKLNYEDAVQLLGLEVLPPSSTSDSRADQLAPHQEKLLQLTKAQISVVTIDESEAIACERVPPVSHLQNQTVSQYRVTLAGETLVSALTIALASEAAQKSEFTHHSPLTTHHLPEKYLPNLSELVAVVHSYRTAGKRIVFTNGCFDILHAGHVSYLNRAKALGDVLIIGVNSDKSVSRLKGPSRPINPLSDRIQVLAALSSVDRLVAFEQDTPIELIQLVRPDVYVKGGDYTKATLPEASLVEQLGGVVEILPFVENLSTTRIIEQIRQI